MRLVAGGLLLRTPRRRTSCQGRQGAFQHIRRVQQVVAAAVKSALSSLMRPFNMADESKLPGALRPEYWKSSTSWLMASMRLQPSFADYRQRRQAPCWASFPPVLRRRLRQAPRLSKWFRYALKAILANALSYSDGYLLISDITRFSSRERFDASRYRYVVYPCYLRRWVHH